MLFGLFQKVEVATSDKFQSYNFTNKLHTFNTKIITNDSLIKCTYIITQRNRTDKRITPIHHLHENPLVELLLLALSRVKPKPPLYL